MAGSALEQSATNDDVVEVAEIHKLPTIAVAVAFPHHMSEQGVAKVHFGIQITHDDHNVTLEMLLAHKFPSLLVASYDK